MKLLNSENYKYQNIKECIFIALAPFFCVDDHILYPMGVAAGVSVTALPFIATPIGTGALIGQGISIIGLSLFGAFSKLHTTSSFLQNTKPTVFSPVEGSGIIVDSVNASNQAGASFIDDSRLLDFSISKLNNAMNNKNFFEINLQKGICYALIGKLEADLKLYAYTLENLNTQVQNTEFAKKEIERSDIEKLRDEMESSGKFPEYEQFVLDTIHATPPEIENAIKLVSQLTEKHIPEKVKGSTIFELLSNALKEIDLTEFLPESLKNTKPSPLPIERIKDNNEGVNGYLMQGDTRPDLVTNLQEILVYLGYDIGNFGPTANGVNGSFWKPTTDAVKKFQENNVDQDGNQLDVDGKVGELTGESLNSAVQNS